MIIDGETRISPMKGGWMSPVFAVLEVRHAWQRAACAGLCAVAVALLPGCDDSSRGTVTVQAANNGTVAGGAPVALHAVVADSGATPTWRLDGPGQLSMTSGTDVAYVPPGREDLDTDATVTVTVSLDSSASAHETLAVLSAPGHSWTTVREASPKWLGIASNGPQFVAVGYDDDNGNGTPASAVIATSPDGKSWTRRTTGSGLQMVSSVTPGDAGWLALGHDSTSLIALRSDDGVTWSPSIVGDGDPFSTATYGQGRYVILGHATSYVSTDAARWQGGNGLGSSSVYGNGVFLSTTTNYGDAYFASQHFLQTSNDGLTWTSVSDDGYSIAFGKGQFVKNIASNFGMDFATSTDGLNWQATPGTNLPYVCHLQFAGSSYFCTDQYRNFWESADGQSWTEAEALPDSIAGIAYGNAGYVRLGELGGIATSTDGANWTTQSSSAGDLFAIEYHDGHFVAMSTPGIAYTSTDARTWTPVVMDRASRPRIGSMTYGNGTWVATAFVQGASRGDTGYYAYWAIYASTDNGATWQRIVAGINELDTLGQVIFDGTRFICSGYLSEFESLDGISWQQRFLSPHTQYAVDRLAFGQGIYVALSQSSGTTILSSTDRQTWEVRAQTATQLKAVTWNGERFVAVGDQGAVASSEDGITWTFGNAGTQARLNAVVGIPGQLVAVGTGGATLSSADGLIWRVHASSISDSLYGVTFAEGRYVAAGYGSVILTSEH